MERLLLRQLAQANAQGAASVIRMASGQRINSAADDPTGLVNVSRLRSELTGVRAAMNNVTAASTVVAGAQLTLDQIQTQLETIRELAEADADGSLTTDERTANQAAIDDAIQSVRDLVATRYGGQRLLDSSADFNYLFRDPTQIRDIQVYDKGNNFYREISGEVTTAAIQASLTHNEATGLITNNATFSLAGARGTTSVTVAVGESLNTVRDRINRVSHLTGITASVSGGVDLTLTSVEYGSDQTVQITVNSGTFSVVSGLPYSEGDDATAVINGVAYTGDGNRFYASDNDLRFTIEFAGGFSGEFTPTFVTGDALRFALTPEPGRVSTLSIRGLHPEMLGGLSGNLADLATGGTYAGLDDNAPRAVRIVDEALAMLTRVQGQVQGFADAAIDSSQALLAGLETNLEDAIDAVDGVDDAEEVVRQDLQAALAQNAVSGLAILANQRADIVSLVRQLAGL